MKNVTPMITSSGERYDIPDDQREAFAADFGDSVQPARRYRTADGDYNIPENQSADFVKDFPDARPVRTIQFAGGETRSFDPDELQKFLSEEYITSPAYKADRDEDAQRQKDKAEEERNSRIASMSYEDLLEGVHGDELRLRKKFYEENQKADSPFMAGLKEFGREYHANLSAGANAAVTPWSSKVSGLVKEAGLLLSSFGADKAGEAVVDVGRGIDKWTNILFRPDLAEEESTVVDVTKKGVGIMSEIGSWYATLKAGGAMGVAGLTLSANANSYVNLYDTAIERGASPEEAGRIATLGGVGDAAVTLGFAMAPIHMIAKAFGFSGEAWAQSGVKKAIGKGWSAIKRAMGIGAAKQMLTNAAITTVEMGGLSAASGGFDEAMRQEAKGEQLDWDKIKDAAKKSGVESAALGAFLSLLPTPAKIKETVKAAERTMSSLPHSATGREILAHNAPEAMADFLEAYEKGGAPSRKQLNDIGVPESAAPTAADRVKLAKLFETGGYKSKDLRMGKVNPEGSIEVEATVVPDQPAPTEPAKGEVVPVEPEPVKAPEKPVEPVKPPEKPVETPPAPVEQPKPPAEPPKNGPVSVPPPEGTTTPPPPAEPPQPAEAPESAAPESKPETPSPVSPAEAGETPAEHSRRIIEEGRRNLAASPNAKTVKTGKKDATATIYTPTDGTGAFKVTRKTFTHGFRGPNRADNEAVSQHLGETLDGSLALPEHGTDGTRFRMAAVKIGGEDAHVLFTINKAGSVTDVDVLKGLNAKRNPEGTKLSTSETLAAGPFEVSEGSIADFDRVWQEQFKPGIIEHDKIKGREVEYVRDDPPPAAEVPAKTETGGNQGDAAQQLSAMSDEDIEKAFAEALGEKEAATEAPPPTSPAPTVNKGKGKVPAKTETAGTVQGGNEESFLAPMKPFQRKNAERALHRPVGRGEMSKFDGMSDATMLESFIGRDDVVISSVPHGRSAAGGGNVYSVFFKGENNPESITKTALDYARHIGLRVEDADPADAWRWGEDVNYDGTPTNPATPKSSAPTVNKGKVPAKKPKTVKADPKKAAKAVEGFVATDPTRKPLMHVHHDHEGGVAVATDGRVLIATKHGYDKNAKDDPEAPYPNWRQVIPDYDGKTYRTFTEEYVEGKGKWRKKAVDLPVHTLEADPAAVSSACKKAASLAKAVGHEGEVYASLELPDGERIMMDPAYLRKVADAMGANGITEIRAVAPNRPILAKNADTTIVAMPLRGGTTDAPTGRVSGNPLVIDAMTGRILTAPERSDNTAMTSRKWADELKKQIARDRDDAMADARTKDLFKNIAGAWKRGETDAKAVFNGYSGDGAWEKLPQTERTRFEEWFALKDENALAEKVAEYVADQFPDLNRWRKDLPREVAKIEKRIAAEDEIDALMAGEPPPAPVPKPVNKGKGKVVKSVQAAKALGSPDAASPLRPAPKGAEPVQGELDGWRVEEMDAREGTNLAGISRLVQEAQDSGARPRGRQEHFNLSKTPEAIKEVLPGEYFTVKAGVVLDHYGKDADHSLSPQDWVNISDALHDPLVIAKYSTPRKDGTRYYPPNSFRVWVEALVNGHKAMVGVEVKSPSRDISVNSVSTVYGDEHVSLNPDDVVYSRGNGEGIRTLLGGPNPREYSGSLAAGENIPHSPAAVKGEEAKKADGRAIRPADLAPASEAKDPAADPQNAARNPGALRDPAFVKWAKSKGRAPTPFARRAYDAAQLKAAAPLYRNVFPGMNIVIHDKVEDPAKWTADHPDGTQKQISGIYTGSAADYEKPSLHAVGTGEGSQVYGWGLYGSTVRGVAEKYAMPSGLEIRRHGNVVKPWNDKIAGLIRNNFSSRNPIESALKEAKENGWDQKDIESLENGDYEVVASHSNLYEQTFFTDRAPGDESHLLKWYEPISEEQLGWIRAQAEKEGIPVYEYGNGKTGRNILGKSIGLKVDGTGGNIYEAVKEGFEWENSKDAPRLSSEFLARAGIDGVKYPVDSYGGKTIKDGDEAGWNYVSFRDDNIRVDHKWRDGEQLKMIVDPKSGEVLGWYTPQFKEVHLNPGATVETLAHEMLHAVQDWAKANSPKLAKTLDDIARDCPPKLRQRILRAYGVVSPEAIMKEWGAFNFMGGPEGGKGRGGEALRDELAKRENAAWLGRFWSAAKDAWKDMAAKMGGNRIDLDAIDAKTPQEAMDFLARAFAEGGTVGKANPPGKSVRPAIDMTKPLSFAEKWNVNLHDYRSPLKWLRDEMAKRGSSFADDTDFYEAARLQKGYDQAAVNDADRRLKEYTGKLKKLGVKHEEVVEFMQAQAAKDRNAMIREKFGREDGSGMTDAEAAATLKAFDDAGKGDALREISDFLLDMQREGLQYRVETGLLSAEDAQRMADREPFHVPFRSAVDPETGDYVQWGSDKALEKAEFKEAKGRKTLADDVVGWMFSEFIDAHTRGNENRIRKMVADAMRLNAESGVGKILKGARKQSAYDFSAGPYKTGADGDGLTGDKAKAAIVDDPRFRESRKNGDGGRKNVLAFKEGGRTHYIEFAPGERGERLQAAVNGRDLKSMGKLWKRGMRFWSSTATEWAPTFALRNFAADNIDVFGNYIGEHGIVKGSASYARHLKNAAALTPAITRYIATGDIPQGVGGEWIRRYEQSGGLIAGYASEGYGEITSKIDAEIAKSGRSKGAVIARNVALAVPHAVAAVNRYAELLTRVSAFRTQCENGMTDHKAALWSRESTVDFNMIGNLTGISNGLWMFSNSTLGASTRQLVSLSGKYGLSVAAALAGYGIVEAILEILMNGDDEEREAKGEGSGKDVSEYTRANSLYVRRGGKVYRVPFHAGPFSYLKYAGNCAARVAFGKMKLEDAAKKLRAEALSQLFHYTGVGDVNMQSQSGRFADDAATFAGTAAPSLAQPLVQGAFNIDYAGRSIYNEGFPGDKTPRSAQGRRTTPGWAKGATAWLNEATRAEGREAGYVDLPPEVVKMAGEAVGKNLLRDVMNAGTVCAMAFGDEPFDVRNVPVARDFVREVDGNDRRYNDARKEYEANASYLKRHAAEMSAKEREAYVKKFPHARFVAKGKQTLDALETEIRRLRKMEDGYFFKKGKATRYEWPQEKLNEFRAKRRELQAKFLKAMGM